MPAAIPALIAAGGAIAGGLIAKKGAKDAATEQSNAANAAAASEDRRFDISRQDQLAQLAQQREDTKDYRAAGTASLAQLMAGIAPGGQFDERYQRGTFEQDPGFQFRQQQGEQGINRAATASGARYSGATLKALARFNSGLASQEYGAFDQRQNTAQQFFEGNQANRYNRLASLAGIGQTANNALNSAGQQVNSNIAQLGAASGARTANYLQDAAEARASGYVGNANAIGGTIKNLYGAYNDYQAANNLSALQNGTLSNAGYANNDYLTS